MNTKKTAPANIDEYIAGFPRDVQIILEKIRVTIRKAAPEAKEAIKYQMPSFVLEGNLVHFAVWKQHIGLYGSTRNKALKDELSAYAGPKGSLKFPLDKPIPFGLITKIVKFRVKENLKKAEARA